MDLEDELQSKVEQSKDDKLEINRLKEENERVREECESLRKKELQAEEGVRKLQDQITELIDHSALQEKEAEASRRQLEAKTKLLETRKKIRYRLEAKCRRLEKASEEKSAQSAVLEKEVSALKSSVTKLQIEKHEIAHLKEQNDRAREDCNSLRYKELQAEEVVRRLQHEMTELRDYCSALQEKEAEASQRQLEVQQIAHLKEERAREDGDRLRNIELQAEEVVRRLQHEMAELRDYCSALQQKEAEASRRQLEVEEALTRAWSEAEVRQAEVRKQEEYIRQGLAYVEGLKEENKRALDRKDADIAMLQDQLKKAGIEIERQLQAVNCEMDVTMEVRAEEKKEVEPPADKRTTRRQDKVPKGMGEEESKTYFVAKDLEGECRRLKEKLKMEHSSDKMNEEEVKALEREFEEKMKAFRQAKINHMFAMSDEFDRKEKEKAKVPNKRKLLKPVRRVVK